MRFLRKTHTTTRYNICSILAYILYVWYIIEMNDIREYLTRESGVVSTNGLVIPRNLPVVNYRKLRSRGRVNITCSDFGIYHHSRYKGKNYFFCSNCDLYDTLLPLEKTPDDLLEDTI